MTRFNYLVSINEDFLTLCERKAFNKFRSKDDAYKSKLDIIIAQIYIESLDYYFRDTISGDENFWTQAEVEGVIGKLNMILDTHYSVDF